MYIDLVPTRTEFVFKVNLSVSVFVQSVYS